MKKPDQLDQPQFQDNPVAIAKHLTESFDKNDLGEILVAIQSVLRAQNVTALSEVTGMRRENLYRTFRGNVDPPFSRILTLFAGFDVRLVVQALPAREKLPRPKLGRPASSIPKPLSRRKARRKRQRKVQRRSSEG